MVCINKAGLTCDIIRETVDTTGAEEEYIESTIYSALKCYILEVSGRRGFTQEISHETDQGKMTLKIWKKPLVKKGDLVDLTDKDLGSMWRYRVFELEPKKNRGRLKSIYLYLKKYND